MNRLLRIYDISPFETRRDVLSGFRVYSNILMSERSTLTNFAIRSAKKLMVEPSATVGQGPHSAATHDVSCTPHSFGILVHAMLVGLAQHIASRILLDAGTIQIRPCAKHLPLGVRGVRLPQMGSVLHRRSVLYRTCTSVERRSSALRQLPLFLCQRV